jgi:hypothetical protein
MDVGHVHGRGNLALQEIDDRLRCSRRHDDALRNNLHAATLGRVAQWPILAREREL